MDFTDNDIPDDFKKIMDYIANIFSNQLNSFNFNKENNSIFGFSISIGSDGVPKFQKIDSNKIEPFTDVMEFDDRYEIIMDVPGLIDSSQLKIEIQDNSLSFIGIENDMIYQKIFKFENPILMNYSYKLKNRTLIIFIKKQR